MVTEGVHTYFVSTNIIEFKKIILMKDFYISMILDSSYI